MVLNVCALLFQTFFCPDKRSGAKYDLPASFVVLSESAEAASTILSQQVHLYTGCNNIRRKLACEYDQMQFEIFTILKSNQIKSNVGF